MKWIVEATFTDIWGQRHDARSVGMYNEQDAAALADIWMGELENGVPIVRVEVEQIGDGFSQAAYEDHLEQTHGAYK